MTFVERKRHGEKRIRVTTADEAHANQEIRDSLWGKREVLSRIGQVPASEAPTEKSW